MASSLLHEAPENVSASTREMHRALASLIEELEAVDWYAQRIDATEDAELARILAHNRDEEKEHACMTLEWVRRRDPVFDRYLRRLLFQSGAIVEADHADDGSAHERPSHRHDGADGTLGLGSLRARDARAAPGGPAREERR